MNTRSRLIAGGVFLLLAAILVVIITQVDFGGQQEEEIVLTQEPDLFPGIIYEVVTDIRVLDNETGAVFAASTEDGTTWVIREAPEDVDLTLPVDHARISEALYALPTLRPTRTLSEIEALAPYGLDVARYEITFRVSDGSQHTLYVGSLNPTSTGYYVRLTSGVGTAGQVYLVPEFSLSPTLELVSTPPVVTPEPGGEEEEAPEA